MKIRFGVDLLVTTLFLCGLPAATIAQDSASFVRSISVSGQGEASAPPDRATINAGVQIRAATVVEASNQNQEIIEGIIEALADEGVDDADIQTADYSVWPEQQHDPRGSGEVTIVGYRVSNTVRVNVKDVGRIGDIIAAVTNAGANTIHGISFYVEDTSSLEARAREAAMTNARQRAESLAELAGVQLGEVLYVSMSSGGGYPVPVMGGRAEAAAMAIAPSISTGQSSVSVQVQVSYAIE